MQSRAKNYLIILLAFATATAGTVAWRQTQRLNSLQAELLAAKAVPARKIASAKPSSSASPATEVKVASDVAAEPADAAAAQTRQQRNNNRPNLSTLMANPEFAKAWNIERRAQLDNRFAGLFKQLNLSPSQLESFKNLLIERESAAMDVYSAARDKGIDPRSDREALNKLVAESQSDVDQSIKAALGDTAYQQYQNYQTTQPQRAVVAQLEQRLSYSATPLTSAQSSFLVQALSTQTTDAAATDQGGGRNNPFRGGNSVPITDAVIQQAQSVLTPDQVAALKDIQAQQQAQQKISQIFRAGGNSSNGGPRPAGGN